MAYRGKEELLSLKLWEITAEEFTRVYPNKTIFEHTKAIFEAWEKGKPLPDNITEIYPTLKDRPRKKKSRKTKK